MNSIKSVLLGICGRSKLARSRCRFKCVGRGGSRLGRTWSSRRGQLPRRLLPRWRMLGLRRGSGRRRRPGCWSSGRECRAACTVVVAPPAYYPPIPSYYPQGKCRSGPKSHTCPRAQTAWWSTASTITSRVRLGTSRTTDRVVFTTKSCRRRSSCTREQPFAQWRHSRSPRWQWPPPTPR